MRKMGIVVLSGALLACAAPMAQEEQRPRVEAIEAAVASLPEGVSEEEARQHLGRPWGIDDDLFPIRKWTYKLRNDESSEMASIHFLNDKLISGTEEEVIAKMDASLKDLTDADVCWLHGFQLAYDPSPNLNRGLVLSKLRREIERRGILNQIDREHPGKHETAIGMTRYGVLASCGKPDDVNRTTTEGLISEQWVYEKGGGRSFDHSLVYFENGIVTALQD